MAAHHPGFVGGGEQQDRIAGGHHLAVLGQMPQDLAVGRRPDDRVLQVETGDTQVVVGNIPGGAYVLQLLEGGHAVAVEVVHPLVVTPGFFPGQGSLVDTGFDLRKVEGGQQITFLHRGPVVHMDGGDDAAGHEAQPYLALGHELACLTQGYCQQASLHQPHPHRQGPAAPVVRCPGTVSLTATGGQQQEAAAEKK